MNAAEHHDAPQQGERSTGQTVALSAKGLSKDFRGFRAVNNVDLDVVEGQIHALVGPNGAGKTTLFNLLTGYIKPTSGTITVHGKDITGREPEQIAHEGVARSFQITSLFDNLTPREHVELGLQGMAGGGMRFWRSDKQLRQYRERADQLVDEVGLSALADRPAGELAYGQKRALEMALVISLDPTVLLLDEPTAGMGREDVDRTIELVQQIAKGRTVVFVDHNMHVVGSLAHHVTVLMAGEVLARGTYETVRADQRVINAYLGEESNA
ncbi:ABC transporter ATP-binding protein [Ornithinimicrobium cryptoxanthini]|uniref:ABC transporter ATP-binding protein n=1 Tax=Ornithinimicrobium cryptoxanthini TaxID=2934161 RepID=A0ABY4YIN7_9MICO|nr:ABC transporter ATP-binding protein [Ornithinimicrobium cryptoxanthini]USQ76629.1 ABC transporter ATP-binding protein [Ornithinimicrobium cryptoxanthini]